MNTNEIASVDVRESLLDLQYDGGSSDEGMQQPDEGLSAKEKKQVAVCVVILCTIIVVVIVCAIFSHSKEYIMCHTKGETCKKYEGANYLTAK